MEQMLRNDESSVLMRHRREKHNGEEVEFEMTVKASYRHDPMSRQCAEANGIRKIEPEKRINNKNEHHQPGDIEIHCEKSENETVNSQWRVPMIIKKTRCPDASGNRKTRYPDASGYRQNMVPRRVGVP